MSKRLCHAFQQADAKLRLRLNGKGGFSRARKAPNGFTPTVARSTLPGSSRIAYDLATPDQKREFLSTLGSSKVRNLPGELKPRRGLKGITRNGRHKVESAAVWLEREYGIDVLSFLTLTLPSQISACDDNHYSNKVDVVMIPPPDWQRLVKALRRRLTEYLLSVGLPTHLLGVVEVQEQRAENGAGMPLHLHIVFVGRRKGETWGITADTLRGIWKDLCVTYLGYSEVSNFNASVDIQRIRKSVSGYLGKYMSKGTATVQRCAGSALQDFLPTSWYICTRLLSQLETASRLEMSGSQAERAFQFLRDNCAKYAIDLKSIVASSAEGVKTLVGYAISYPTENLLSMSTDVRLFVS